MKALRLISVALLALIAVHCRPAAENAPVELGGMMGLRWQADAANWLVPLYRNNPSMLDLYDTRNEPHGHLMRWYGEFSGKYLSSIALNYAMSRDPRLEEIASEVCARLAAAQDADGYLGVWPDSEKLTGRREDGAYTWDIWSHYHNILGLWLWYKASSDELALDTAIKAADCIYRHICVEGHPFEMESTSFAIAHAFGILYEQTSRQEYLQAAREVLARWTLPGEGEVWRWELLHAVQALAQMWRITGEEHWRSDFCKLWSRIREGDRHNTGGITTGEKLCGDPFAEGPVETCCTIAWMAICMDMLDIEDCPQAADELELSLWNALLGAQHYDGSWFTYDTPMRGYRRPSTQDIAFQSYPGSEQINCCNVNAPRGFGMIGAWGLTERHDTLTLNYLGPSTFRVGNGSIILMQEGSYPFDDTIRLSLKARHGWRGTLRVRIPGWSPQSTVRTGEGLISGIPAGEYLVLDGVSDSFKAEIRLDMRPRLLEGGGALHGRSSVYLGPILLAADERFGPIPERPLDLSSFSIERLPCQCSDAGAPALLLRIRDAQGRQATLCDFASAGATGSAYTSWL